MTIFVLILIGALSTGSGKFAAQPFPTEEACIAAANKMLPVVVGTPDLKAYGIACAKIDLTPITNS